jgi:hypothetical protein
MSMGARRKVKGDSSQVLLRGMAWYYTGVVLLVLLSLFRVTKTADAWAVDFGIGPATSILVALAILPSVLKFLVSQSMSGKVEVAGVFGVSWEAKEKIDRQIVEKQARQRLVAEAAKDSAKNDGYVNEARVDAEVSVEDTIEPQGLAVVHSVYFQELMELVKAFNRNRRSREARSSTVAEADAIAYKMRSMAPLVVGQFDVTSWLSTPNLGKQIAAIKYLEWNQDVDFARDLAIRVNEAEERGDTFQAFHILLALLSMADQLAYEYRESVKGSLSQYLPRGSDSPARRRVQERILGILDLARE